MQETPSTQFVEDVDRRSDRIYLIAITLAGSSALIWSVTQLSFQGPILNLLLLMVLAGAAMISTSYFRIGPSRVAYEVGTAVGLAAVASFGPAGTISVMAFAGVAYWIFNWYINKKARVDQLLFNVNMLVLAALAAGLLFEQLLPLTAGRPAAIAVVWIFTAVTYDQVNLWLLIVLLRLRNGPSFNLLNFWQENLWAIAINIGVLVIGGGLMAYAVQRHGWQGIIIFFLPIVLSALAFRLYTRKMEVHLDNLETIIAARTRELEQANHDLELSNAHLSHLNVQLSDADRAKDRFLAVLSHDMRSPLTGITLYSQMLREQPELPGPRRAQMMQVILQNAQTLVELVDNIVEVEKINNDEITVSRAYFDLTALVKQAVSAFEAHADEQNLELSYSPAHPPIIFNGDAQLIKRVITNLISNAIKYTPPGGTVDVRVRSGNGNIIVEVEDSGYGIPPDELPHIFDVYRRVNGHQSHAKGMGLGLSIVKRYVDAHQGEVDVQSTPGKGSRFRAILPDI